MLELRKRSGINIGWNNWEVFNGFSAESSSFVPLLYRYRYGFSHLPELLDFYSTF